MGVLEVARGRFASVREEKKWRDGCLSAFVFADLVSHSASSRSTGSVAMTPQSILQAFVAGSAAVFCLLRGEGGRASGQSAPPSQPLQQAMRLLLTLAACLIASASSLVDHSAQEQAVLLVKPDLVERGVDSIAAVTRFADRYLAT